MAAAAGDRRSDAEVEELTGQLEGLRVGPTPFIPTPFSSPPQRAVIRPVHTRGRRLVYFDLETTGLGRSSHITQIAACSGEDQAFSCFVLPRIPISPKAAQVTGITAEGHHMFHHGEKVPCLRIKPALQGFIRFLGQEGQEGQKGQKGHKGQKGQEGQRGQRAVVLVGHNSRSFDCPILLNALRSCHLVEEFQRAVHCCVDSLPLLREMVPKPGVDNHQLGTLYHHYTGHDFPAHDASEDVRALQVIVETAHPDHDALQRHSFAFDDVIERQRWTDLVTQGVITKYMADKACKSGLSWCDVTLTFHQNGEDGVRSLLEDRLTRVGKVINSVVQHLKINHSEDD